MTYAELHCRSAFSFREGASLPEDLVQRAAELGLSALALTDRDGVYGAPRFWKAARAAGIRPLVGADVAVPDGRRLLLLCESQRGYQNLCRLLSRAHLENPRETPCASWDALADSAAGLVVLCRDQELLDRTAALWPRATAVELSRHLLPDEERANQRLLACARRMRLPVVATGDVRYAKPERRPLHDALTCIRHLTTLDQAGTRLLPNGEYHLKSPAEMAARFHDVPEAIANAHALGERCAFTLDDLGYHFPPYPVPDGATQASHLRHLVHQGARQRYGDPPPARVRKQLEHELDLITRLDLAGYFLIVWDLVEFARSRGILVQGRGSAANSAVCYALGITAVDPIGMELLFERFLSEARGEWPDIDLDLPSGDPREEVIQYVYRRYGQHGAAMTAEVITYRGRSAVRDLGKVLDLPPQPIDRLAKLLSPFEFTDDADTIQAQIGEAGLDPAAPRVKLLIDLATQIEGLPRHLSQHSGGMVVTAGRLDQVVPLEAAAMPNRVVIQWDKDDCADLKIVKVDLLGLGMMAVLADCIPLARQHAGVEIDLAQLPPGDPRVYDLLQRADTVGLFQVESRAQMSCLPRLKPRNFYDIVVEVAIIRPGPIQGNSVHPYLERRAGRQPITYAHPCLEPILRRTLGVPLFQEQGMRIAMEAAGFSAAEAEELRRAMGHKRSRQRMAELQDRLIQGMRKKGIPEPACQQIWQQLMAFADYGFPECVVGETRVIDTNTGRWLPIKDIVSGRARLPTTLACTGVDSRPSSKTKWEPLRLRKRRVLEATPSGQRPVIRIRTALGRSIVATAEHPFLTIDGWRALGDLHVGEHVATARRLPELGCQRWPRHKIIVLADLIAEGNLCHPTTFYFYTSDIRYRDEFICCVERFANTRATIARHRSCYSIHVRRKIASRPIGAVEWLRGLGVWDRGAREKHLPDEVFELCLSDLALLLARLWEGDGHLSFARHASYDTASRRLAEEIQHLLLRFGIVSRIYKRTRAYRGRQVTGFTVTVTGANDLERFYLAIGRRFLHPRKQQTAQALARATEDGRMSRDVIPAGVKTLIRKARSDRAATWTGIGRATGLSMREIQSCGASKIGFRRWVIGRIGRHLQSPELTRLATSDIYWDRVTAIEPLGLRETYDLHIDGDHNFVANDFIVHNSHAASFALLVYASAYLKAHHPALFTCAMLNNWPLGFYHPSTLIKDAERHGVEVRPPDVTRSDWLCTVEQGALRIGLKYVSGLPEAAGRRIEEQRGRRAFASLEELAERTALRRCDLEALAEAGALGAFGLERREALWRVHALDGAGPLDPPPPREPSPLVPMTADETLRADYAVLGLTCGPHPMALERTALAHAGVVRACDLGALPDGAPVRVGGVAIVRQRPGTAKGFCFVTLEDETGFANVIVTPQRFQRARSVLLGAAVLVIDGTLQKQDGVISVRGRRFAPWRSGAGPEVSRDFR